MLSGFSGGPVLDRTGVTGNFDIRLQWNQFAGWTQPDQDVQRTPQAEAREPSIDLGSLPSLFTALEQQLGFKLELRKGSVETYVIDHVQRPSEN
jgi:uncharacterized protein (TIGR03435 family)